MSAYGDYLKTLAPKGWWPLDDAVGSAVAADQSGNGFNATLESGAPTFGIGGPVVNQTALDNNNSEWLTTLLPDNTWDALSIILWLQGPWFGNGGNPRLAAAGHTDGDGSGFQLGFFNNLAFDVGGQGELSIESSGSWVANAWHMAVGTYDGASGDAAMYFDGAEAASATWAGGNLVTARSNFGFGYNPTYNGDQWSGDLAEVAIFPTALKASDVALLYTLSTRFYPAWIGEGGFL